MYNLLILQGKDIKRNHFLLSVIGQTIALLRHFITLMYIIPTFEKTILNIMFDLVSGFLNSNTINN